MNAHARRRTARGRTCPALLVALAVGALAFEPRALAADGQAFVDNATAELAQVDRESSSVDDAMARARGEALTPEQRTANGELLYRMKDYARASVVLSEVIEKFPGTPSQAYAYWYRAEAYYESHEYLSARRDYKAILSHADEPVFNVKAPQAAARIVDIALRINDIASLDDVLPLLNRLGANSNDPVVLYAKGKAYYVKKDYPAATQSLAAVPPNTQYAHQARYFRGLVELKLSRGAQATSTAKTTDDATPRTLPNFKSAIEAFRQVTELPPDTPEHRHVIDLAWMAVGRLFYEMEQYQQASEAYGRVGRESPEFETMLYELGWVYVRLGDVQRAERALEILAISNPNSTYIADGTLLRADLLLRAGAYPSALKLYEG
ncbi:tetratricopeptide repeat protein, partial [bacterium]